MNILEICVVPDLGGLELYFHRCCVALKARGHALLSVRLEGSRLEDLGRKDNIPMLLMKGGNKFLPLRRARALAKAIETHGIDIVHCHHRKDMALVALTKQLCKRSFQYVFTRQMPMKQGKKDPYHRWIYSRIDLYITITELLKRDAIEKLTLSPERIQRLYYGVPPPPPIDEAFLKEFLSISQPGDFNIGVFSRLERQKGQHMAIAALKKLRDLGVPAKLYIVGHSVNQGYSDELISSMHNLQLDNDIVFKGFLSDPAKAMLGMDVLMLPSRNEAFGLVLPEAMRCGVAVMGVNAGGVPEIIDDGQTGLLFEWENVDQLTQQLTNLYENPAFRKELALRGKEKADREFDYDLHFDRLEKLFARLNS